MTKIFYKENYFSSPKTFNDAILVTIKTKSFVISVTVTINFYTMSALVSYYNTIGWYKHHLLKGIGVAE